ncbi:M48 family metallopeptidase [Thioalkalivibrio sp. HK1]|uniref:M48 family metallopeptidase n=1 Tax=Thioalkalivibrio sp. HK1 TaxID=1469245 RepID=UPI00046ECC4C|nr:SprT family zinc-dependent metalloprotease [Thioalkalivibrio sp. HK1]
MATTIERRATVRLFSTDLPFIFKRVPRRRHIHFLINEAGELELRAPWRFGLERAQAILRENETKVLDLLEKSRRRRSERPPLITGTLLPLLDRSLTLEVHRSSFSVDAKRRPSRVERRGDNLWVSVPDSEPDFLRKALEKWYRRQGKIHFAERIQYYLPQLDVPEPTLSIRGQRARWGSCSTTGRVSLNWRLMMAPVALSDYVVVHELCHLRYMNHSASFWSLVESIVPDYRLRRRRLNALQFPL